MVSDDRERELLLKIEALVVERERLRGVCEIWRARAFAMFWKLPAELSVGSLQDDVERARTFLKEERFD